MPWRAGRPWRRAHRRFTRAAGLVLPPPADEAAKRYAEIARIHEPYVDLLICETMSSVDQLSAREDLDPTQYANFAQHWVDAGATIVGGCCEVGPAHIAELVARFR